MKDLINIDEKYPECTNIDTEAWLTAVLGPEVLTEETESKMDGKWLMEAKYVILEAIENAEGTDYSCTNVDNVYNNENDFSSVFQWQVFYPKSASDWMYAGDVYVAIEVHRGGDVRGNYGRVRLYKVDDLADSNFFDWCLGWTVNYDDKTEVPENDRFSIGYASHPFHEMTKHLKDGDRNIEWSEEKRCFVTIYQDEKTVELHPYLYV
jgi:hypothetical protein